MSDQGPGGYGGGGYGGGVPPGGAPPGGQPPGGQGGWGQPPGAPPGGYGQPPGGYGPPPGGYGQPPGAPAGYPPHQGYGQPAPPGPPAKKSNAPLIIGLGCGALLLLGGASAAWFYFAIVRPAQEVASAVSALDGGLGATVSLSDAGVVVKLPGVGEITAAAPPPPAATEAPTAATPGAAAPARPGTPSPSASAAPSAVPTPTNVTLTPGGPSCAAAAACCRAVLEKTGATTQIAQCEQLKSAPEAACAQALASQRQIATVVGAKCP